MTLKKNHINKHKENSDFPEAFPLERDHLHTGMPALDESAYKISWFEFANPKLFYTPIVFYIAWLSLKYFGIRQPIAANPAIPYSGLVGESKSIVLDRVTGDSRQLISPYQKLIRTNDIDLSIQTVKDAAKQLDITYPFVLKPDLGMRGAGVQLIKNDQQLRNYIEHFPENGPFLIQKLIPYEGEAGLFYVRHPDWDKGRIISLTLKYFPFVIGDGHSTLQELIEKDPRAGQLQHLYTERFTQELDQVLETGQRKRLAFAGNHCRGTIFRNGNEFITPEMGVAIDKVARSMGEFYIGRIDLRFEHFDLLKQGKGFQIIEINGAGGEATHIWDARTRLFEAYKSLGAQFKHIYAIGRKNRKRGFQPASYRDLITAWQTEKKLTRDYPLTD